MKIKKLLSLFLAAALVLSFGGCMKREENPDEENLPEVTEEDELVLYHNNTELAPMLMALTEKYSSETGKKLSAKLAGNDFMGEMQSSSGAIYVVDSHSDLSNWHSGGLFTDLMNHSGFSEMLQGVPAGLQLNPDGIGSYGIPLALEGFGYIFDREMISALFGEENTNEIVEDLRSCSFTDFESFVAAADSYIASPSEAKITLNGNEYTFLPEKTGKAAMLTGVFALNSESSRASEHLLSYVLASKFKSRYEIMTAPEEAVEGLDKILPSYMEALDLQTSHIAGAEGNISRGDEFIGGDYNYSTSIDLLTRGNALFYPGGTSDAADFEKSAEGFSENLDIIPMKLPVSEDEITASGMTAEKLNSSIVISSRYYIAVNPKADENSSAAAREFINWLYNEESGRKAYSEAFKAVPFNFEYLMTGQENSVPETENSSEAPEPENPSPENSSEPSSENSASEGTGKSGTEQNPGIETRPSHSVSNSLMAAVADYYAKGNWIPDMSFALPGDFSEKVLGKNLGDFWGMENWAEADRKNFIEKFIEGWRERINKENTAVG